MLVVNPTWDPITPLVSARNLTTILRGSVLLEHHGNGHTSFGQRSLCTPQAMEDYMVEGELPASGARCEVVQPLFGEPELLEVPGRPSDYIWAREWRETVIL